MAAAVVVRPEDTAARDAKRRERSHHRDERSPDAKRRQRDDAHYRCDDAHYRVSSSADRKRKRDSIRGSRGDDRRRGYSSSSRDSRTRTTSHARRTSKNRDDERAQGARRRSRSPPSEPKTRLQVPCARTPQAQPQLLPAATIAAPSPRVAAAITNSQPPQDLTEQFEEAELRRRETQRKREEARREMDKVVQSVYFNDPFVSLTDILKR